MYGIVYKNKWGFVIPDEHIPSDKDMERYAEGNADVVNSLIEGMMGYIVNSVEWFLHHTETAKPYSEDCLCVAMLSLTVFVKDNLGKKYTPQHFMNSAKLQCLSRIKDWLREMSITVSLPSRTGRRNDIVMVRQRLTSTEMFSADGGVFDKVWFHQFLGMLDDFDRQLVELRMDGQSDRAIGRTVGLDHTLVKNHLVRLANLYFDGE